MAWINLLEVIYPVGSIYFSAVDASPALSVGGTWNKLTGGLLGLDGSEGVAAAGSNGGSRKITTDQIPSHNHRTNATDVVLNRAVGITLTVSGGSGATFAQDYLLTDYVGGGRITYPPTLRSALGEESPNLLGGVRLCLGLTC